MAQQGFGAPASRPDEDTCVVATSFELDRDRRCWEATAAIAWAVNSPRPMAPREVVSVLRDCFRNLRRDDVVVSRHFPEEFLLKFERKEDCDAAIKKKRIKVDDGSSVFIMPWRPLAHALGEALFFRVHLHLGGIPPFAWTPNIVERLLGRRCALESFDDRSVTMTDTRALGLWAWTTNPSALPKVIWLTFTSRSPDADVAVARKKPTKFKRGSTFRVLIHLDTVEDYSAAPIDCDGHDGAPPFSAPSGSLNWNHGTRDGDPIDLSNGSGAEVPPDFDSRGSRAAAARKA